VLLVAGFGLDGYDGALATALGCGIAIFPNAYFTLQAFRYKASEDPVRALAAFYRGETGKIILVMVLCALTFKFLVLHNPLLLFTALFVMLVTQTVASVLVVPALKKPDVNTLKNNDTEID